MYYFYKKNEYFCNFLWQNFSKTYSKMHQRQLSARFFKDIWCKYTHFSQDNLKPERNRWTRGIRILGHFRYPNTPRFVRNNSETRYIIVSQLGYSSNPNPEDINTMAARGVDVKTKPHSLSDLTAEVSQCAWKINIYFFFQNSLLLVTYSHGAGKA